MSGTNGQRAHKRCNDRAMRHLLLADSLRSEGFTRICICLPIALRANRLYDCKPSSGSGSASFSFELTGIRMWAGTSLIEGLQ
jgi:hypothetical protein